MRKRTYTALINTSESVCTSSRVVKHANTTSVGRDNSATDGDDKCNDVDTSTVMSSYMNYTDTVTTAMDVASETPLTTIHNLVGTCEIASSIVPIDLEYVYRCLPNRYIYIHHVIELL